LRLRDEELEEMGVNVRWRGVLRDARERLRMECLGGRIWGFGGVNHEEVEEGGGRRDSLDESMEMEIEDWKKSWRIIQGRRSSGRVKGILQAFEPPSPTTDSPTRKEEVPYPSRSSSRSSIYLPNDTHQRSESIDSTTSTASIDSGHSSPRRSDSPFFDLPTSNRNPFDTPLPNHHIDPFYTSPDVPSTYQSKITSHAPETRPYELVRRPSAKKSSILTRRGSHFEAAGTLIDAIDWDASSELNDGGGVPTVRSNGTGTSGRSALKDLFGIENYAGSTPSKERGVEELLAMQVGGKGSMILVKRSQLDDLRRRIDESVNYVLLDGRY
jgi:hypothetical protein